PCNARCWRRVLARSTASPQRVPASALKSQSLATGSAPTTSPSLWVVCRPRSLPPTATAQRSLFPSALLSAPLPSPQPTPVATREALASRCVTSEYPKPGAASGKSQPPIAKSRPTASPQRTTPLPSSAPKSRSLAARGRGRKLCRVCLRRAPPNPVHGASHQRPLHTGHQRAAFRGPHKRDHRRLGNGYHDCQRQLRSDCEHRPDRPDIGPPTEPEPGPLRSWNHPGQEFCSICFADWWCVGEGGRR